MLDEKIITGVSMWDKIIGIFSGNLVKDVGDAIDKLVTSDEERIQLNNELARIQSSAELEIQKLELEHERETTKRWVSDNEHLVTRLVRPISFMFVLFLFAIIVLGDGNLGTSFFVNPAYVPVIESLLVTMVVAYFGGRSGEKISKIIKR